jgi:hypothetical protein
VRFVMIIGGLNFLMLMCEYWRLDFSCHHLILILHHGDLNDRMPTPFMLESAWLLEESYKEMLKSTWNVSDIVMRNLSSLHNQVDNWKLRSIDSVKHAKRTIMSRLDGIQKCIQ